MLKNDLVCLHFKIECCYKKKGGGWAEEYCITFNGYGLLVKWMDSFYTHIITQSTEHASSGNHCLQVAINAMILSNNVNANDLPCGDFKWQNDFSCIVINVSC